MPTTDAEGEGLAYFSGVLSLTSALDGREVIRGFLDGIKGGADND